MNLSKKKVAEILVLLSAEELNRLHDFVQSPYHVKLEDRATFLKMLQLFGSITTAGSSLDHPEEILFASLFPGEDFISGRFDKKLSQFTSIVMKFIGQEELEKGNAIELSALQFLRSHGESKLYPKEFKKIKKRFVGKKSETIDAPLTNFEIDLEECRFINLDLYRINQESFDRVYQSLDNLYIYYFIYLGIRNLAYNNFTKPGEIRSKFDPLLAVIEKRSKDEKTRPQLFIEDLFKILLDNSSLGNQKIAELSQRLEAIKDELHQEDYKNYRTIIRSFVLVQYNSGDYSLGSTLFGIYQREVANGAIFFEGKISSAVINNICMAAIRENEIEWLDEFLNSIEGKVMEANLEKFVIALNRSKLLFVQKQFDAVLDMLIFEVKEMYLKVYARILELMVYYELDSDQLSYKIEAYKLFIFRIPKTKIGVGFIEGHHNFIRILRSISHTSTTYDLKRIQRLKKKIISTKILAERKWLLEKIEYLESKNK